MQMVPQIADRWAEIRAMDRLELRVAWRRAFNNAPPHYLSMNFMRKAVMSHEQTQMFGGLSAELKRAVSLMSGGQEAGREVVPIRPGTQLVREWNGRRYQVEVTNTGFELNGEHFKSLSAIAAHITGTSWSGPRFFGLKGKRRCPA